jgi:hypothetical protein
VGPIRYGCGLAFLRYCDQAQTKRPIDAAARKVGRGAGFAMQHDRATADPGALQQPLTTNAQ